MSRGPAPRGLPGWDADSLQTFSALLRVGLSDVELREIFCRPLAEIQHAAAHLAAVIWPGLSSEQVAARRGATAPRP